MHHLTLTLDNAVAVGLLRDWPIHPRKFDSARPNDSVQPCWSTTSTGQLPSVGMPIRSGQTGMLLEELIRCAFALFHDLFHRADRNYKCSSKGTDSTIKIGRIFIVHQIRRAGAQRLASLNRYGNQRRVAEVNSWPFCNVHCPLSQLGDTCRHINSELLSFFMRVPQLFQKRLWKVVTNLLWIGFIQRAQKVPHCNHITIVREEEEHICPSSHEPSLDGRREERCEHRYKHSGYRSDSGPSVPVNRTSSAKQPALANTIQHAHFVPPVDWPAFCHGQAAGACHA